MSGLLQKLDHYERLVFGRRDAQAMPALIDLLDLLRQRRLEAADGAEIAQVLMLVGTRIAAAVGAHLLQPQLRISQDDLEKLCSCKRALEMVFQVSGFEGMRHVQALLAQPDEQSRLVLTQQGILLSALISSLDGIDEAVFRAALELPPALLAPLLLGWLNGNLILSSAGEARRVALIAASPALAELEPSRQLVELAGKVWFHCSYADTPARHEIKRALNRMWQRWAALQKVQARSAPRRHAERPTLLMLAEHWHSRHAMWRSYGADVASLREHFRTVLLLGSDAPADLDAPAREGFDEVYTCAGDAAPLREVVGLVIRIAPDLIYYPSLGMARWTQALATQRLAPIQFISLGHPASSMSEAIDYVMLQSCHADAPRHFSETVLVRTGTGRHAPFARQLPSPLPSRPLRGVGEALHIGVNSALKKLSHRLLAVCEQLDREAGRPLHFHFFPYGRDLALTDLEWQLRRRLRSVTVHSQTDYAGYLQALGNCDLALASFPFGNTNSTVDAAMLGIPVVAFEGDEPLSLGDRRVLRDLRAPDWLLARDPQAYADAALRLLRDDGLRVEVGDALRQGLGMVFGHDEPAQRSDFGDAVRWMYQRHEAIQASGRPVLQVGEALD